MPLTLPPLPKSYGAIRNVFLSSLYSVQSKANPLGFGPAKSVMVVFVDGLGAEQLKERAGHAPWLASKLDSKSIVHCAFPATTSANVGSFATGLLPGEHGLIGHQVWDRRHNERLNLLVGWNERTDPLLWQPYQTIAELATEQGIPAYNIAHEEYRDTPYTRATMRGAVFKPGNSIADRFSAAAEVLSQRQGSISYLYVPELDKYGHKHGWRSAGWAAILEELDSELKRFSAKLPKDCGLVVTSDHGMIETTKDRQLVLDDYLADLGLEFFGGDTRATYLYLEPEASRVEVINALEPLGHALSAFDAEELVRAGWYGKISQEARDRLPELVLLARNNFTLYHSKFSKQRAFDMISHHGSVSDAEMRIPLIRVGL